MLILPKDIYDIYREYEQDPSDGKYRPNLVIFADDDDIYCLPLTGTAPNDQSRHKDDFWKIEVDNWQNAQLKKKSWVIVSQLKIINKEVIEKANYIGPLHDDDWHKVVEKSAEYEQYIATIRKSRSVRSRNKRKNS
ncbi:PemK-like protein [compost metagenome]